MSEHNGDGKHTRRQWQAHIQAQKKSGLSRAEYCRKYDLSYHALAYWQRKLSGPSRQHTPLVPVPVESITRHDLSASTSGVKILLDDRIAIEVAEQFSPGTLSRVLSVLENR